MGIQHLEIQNVRNIQSQKIEFCSGLNVFYGKNGSGKTSVIEAIHILGTGKSFRASQIRQVVKEGESELIVFSRLQNEENKAVSIGIQRNKTEFHAKIDGVRIKGLSELAKQLPLLVITPESHRLLESGPSWRRKYLDWGVFHVEHQYASVWSKYHTALKQRNSLLQQKGSQLNIQTWTETLCSLGEDLHQYRFAYFEKLTPLLNKFSDIFLPGQRLEFEYSIGWPKHGTLHDALESHLVQDLQHGRTEYGPHRADLKIRFNGMNARETVSRGQQKLLVYAMQLAQIDCIYETASKRTTLLLDDLSAELDEEKIGLLLNTINKEFNQVVITTADLNSIPVERFTNKRLFHVEHGLITSA